MGREPIVRWGILGNAGIARKALIPAIRRAVNARLHAIASSSGRAREAVEEFGFEKGYESYESLLEDPEVDAVYIPLPNSLHVEWVMKAAEAGKHVLCEKPAALTEDEAAGMIDACRRHGVIFMEAFMYQFHPQHDKVKALMAAGEIGDVRLMRSRFSFMMKDKGSNIRTNPELGGGSLYDVGCYCIHSSRYLFDKEPVKVYAQARIDEKFNVDLTAGGVLSFEDGIQALFDCGFETPGEEFYEIIGTAGKLKVNYPYRPDKNPNGIGAVTLEKPGEDPVVFKVPGEQYKLEVEHFSKCVLEGSEPRYAGGETLKNMRVIDACLRSIRSGQAVSLGGR